MPDPHDLSRRERQIMDVIYARTQATADDVVAGMDDPPTRTAVRTLLRILEDKGLVTHEKQGRAFLYRPTRPREKAGKSAFRRVLETFFSGSIEQALAAHLAEPGTRLSPDEADRLAALIAEARKQTPKAGGSRGR